MLYRLLVGLIAAVGLLVVAVPALAGPPETNTINQKNIVETFVDVLPTCEGGPLYTITTTSNLVDHVTEFADGRFHGTFTQAGKVVAVPLRTRACRATRVASRSGATSTPTARQSTARSRST